MSPLTGTVSGTPAESVPAPDELSTRRFLTRMHLAHGYPGGTNAKWFWAVVVDAMAFVMVFWGASGLFMWWQLKGARLPGFAVLLCSAAAATALFHMLSLAFRRRLIVAIEAWTITAGEAAFLNHLLSRSLPFFSARV